MKRIVKLSLFILCGALVMISSNDIEAKRVKKTRKQQGTAKMVEPKKFTFLAGYAKYWYDKAQAGDAEAQYQLAECFFQQIGCKESSDDCIYWLKMASNQGHTLAMIKLADYERDDDGERNEKLVRQAYNKAMAIVQNGEDAVAECALGYYYSIVEYDDTKAKIWYEKAAKKNYPEALNHLSKIIKSKSNYDPEAGKYLIKAAELGDPLSMYDLADAYSHNNFGLGGVNNKLWAKWLIESIEAGYKFAIIKALEESRFFTGSNEYEKDIVKALQNVDTRLIQDSEDYIQRVKDALNKIQEEEEADSPLKGEMERYSALEGVWHLSTNRNHAIRITLYPSSGRVKFELWVGRAGVQWVEYPDAHYVSPGQIYVNGGYDFGKVTFRLSGNKLVGADGRTYYK